MLNTIQRTEITEELGMKRLYKFEEKIETKFRWSLRGYFNEEWNLPQKPQRPAVNDVINEVKILAPVLNPEDFEYVQCAADLNWFPIEVLTHIFAFLNPADIQCAGLVCRRWLYASKYRKFTNQFFLNFTERYSVGFSVPIQSFSKCQRIFSTICLSNSQVTDYASEDFFIYYGDNLREIIFNSGLLRKDEFINVVKYAKNLEKFAIEENSMFKSWEFNHCSFERRVLLMNCKEVGLAGNTYLNNNIVDFMLSTAPNLTTLDISNCLHTMSPLERNKLLDYILAYLRIRAHNIKSLNLANTVTDDYFLDNLSQVQNLQLLELHLTFMGSTKNSNFGITCLIASQPKLEYFDLTASPSVNDYVVTEITKCMPKLKKLQLKKCHNLTNHGVKQISKLIHLQFLEISNCDHVTDVGITDGVLQGTPFKALRELYLGLLTEITEGIFPNLACQYENLYTLDLGGSNVAVTDNAMQLIFKHMVSLRFLNVDSCSKITDYGFTGVPIENPEGPRFYSIRNVKGLKILRCSGCYRVTDFSLIDSFEFLELKELHASRCNITNKGVATLVKNCPSLELLDFTECKNLDDDAVTMISECLPRLKTLKLNGCDKITERSLDKIYQNCHELKNLFLRNCKIRCNPSDYFTYMRCLRKVVI